MRLLVKYAPLPKKVKNKKKKCRQESFSISVFCVWQGKLLDIAGTQRVPLSDTAGTQQLHTLVRKIRRTFVSKTEG